MTSVDTSVSSDLILVEKARKDTRLAEQLLLRLLPKIRRAIRIMIRDDAEAEDLISKTLLDVYENLAEYRGTGPLEAWAGRIAFNVTLRHKQRNRMIHRLMEPEAKDMGVELSNPEIEAANLRFREKAEMAMASLPEDRREALVLRLVLGHSIAEIAKMTGAPANTVRGRLRTGLKELRRSMAADRDFIMAR